MNYQIKDTFTFCFRWQKTWQGFRALPYVLLTLNMLWVISATAASAVELVSVNKDGTDSGDYSSVEPVTSADGRFVAFSSAASDLVATDMNGMHDVFVRDLRSGTTTLISVNKAGTGSGNQESKYPVISADGRFVAFHSYADDLVAADTNGEYDVFVRDLQNGTTTLVSVNKDGTGSGNNGSSDPVISADGRFVAFTSYADDLVATDTNGMQDLFVRDLQSGATTLVSVNKDGTDSGNRESFGPVISGDGRFIAFISDADDLVATDTNAMTDVFVRDLQSGSTTLVSVDKDGTDSSNSSSGFPVISAQGRFIAFRSGANNLVATDSNDMEDVFLRDLQSGTTILVSVDKDGADSGNGSSLSPEISADGRYVAFFSGANNLVEMDTNDMDDVFVRDVLSGTTSLVSVNKDGTNSGNNYGSFYPVISADGRFVAFASFSDDLVATDTNSTMDVFVRDIESGNTTLVSVNKEGTDSGNDTSLQPVISANGRFVVFVSTAGDLVATDTNNNMDVFAYEVVGEPQGCNCADPMALTGTADSDFIFGTEQSDIICGFEGQDFIAGMGGDDCIDGGEGDDWIYGSSGNDTMYGRAGKDVIYGDDGNDVISGDEDDDYLFGGSGDDKLDGGEGYDWIFCGGGTDEGVGEYKRKCEN